MHAASIERLIRRNGVPVTVRRTTGAVDQVTSTRTTQELEVQTIGVRPQPVQKAAKGDPLSTQEAAYLVPISAFCGRFEPRDGDLVIDDGSESRVLAVRKKGVRSRDVAYQLVVSGVTFGGA